MGVKEIPEEIMLRLLWEFFYVMSMWMCRKAKENVVEDAEYLRCRGLKSRNIAGYRNAEPKMCASASLKSIFASVFYLLNVHITKVIRRNREPVRLKLV
jgi:hypothetical protein